MSVSLGVPDWVIAYFAKSFIFLAIMIPVTLLGRWILSRMKDGKLKRLLSRRVGP
jgi:hypothetical protein